MLKLEQIHKAFNKGTVDETKLFDGFSLTVPAGQFVSIVGSNGSGKTTLLNLICGTLPLDGGQISLGGVALNPLGEHKRAARIGRVFQDPAKGASPQMTILENLALADNKGKRYGLSAGVNRRKIGQYQQMLKQLRLGLEDKLHTPVGLLSGGQRQALSLLISTMTPIDLLILDEHTAALDPKTSETIMELTGRIVAEKKVTTLMVTHNLRYAVEYGSRILMMHKGEAVLDRGGADKSSVQVSDLLGLFAEISVELGN